MGKAGVVVVVFEMAVLEIGSKMIGCGLNGEEPNEERCWGWRLDLTKRDRIGKGVVDVGRALECSSIWLGPSSLLLLLLKPSS